jgi:hypothetical protein
LQNFGIFPIVQLARKYASIYASGIQALILNVTHSVLQPVLPPKLTQNFPDLAKIGQPLETGFKPVQTHLKSVIIFFVCFTT